jgi:hypothetical protein
MASPVKAFIQPTAPTFRELKSMPFRNVLFPKLRQPVISWPVVVSSFPVSSPRYTLVNYNDSKPPASIVQLPCFTKNVLASNIGYKIIVTFPSIYDSLSARPYFGQIWPRNILN